MFDRWVERGGAVLERAGRFVAFALETAAALPAALRHPGLVVEQFGRVLLGSLPMAAVAGAALGVVAWLQIRCLLFHFQSVSLLPSALALAVVWEFGPVSAGLIAAGRVGAGLGAELGSMKITEQIDALRMLAVSPMRRLVAPRVLACMLALPFLAVFIDYVAVLSSYAAEAVGGTMTWTQYRLECLRYLRLIDAIPATLKTVVFGFLVGVSGCWCGLQAGHGTEEVGRASTRAVVLATLLVLVADVLLVRIIQLLVSGEW
jgi:phospholipid/cholesterol/gamma-HCH transport system permease protein